MKKRSGDGEKEMKGRRRRKGKSANLTTWRQPVESLLKLLGIDLIYPS